MLSKRVGVQMCSSNKMNYKKVLNSNEYRKTTLDKQCREDLTKYTVNFIVDCILIADSYSIERNAVIKRVFDTFNALAETSDFSKIDVNKWLFSENSK